jgi:hypothetical protein
MFLLSEKFSPIEKKTGRHISGSLEEWGWNTNGMPALSVTHENEQVMVSH